MHETTMKHRSETNENVHETTMKHAGSELWQDA
jgi:hypothetical protein